MLRSRLAPFLALVLAAATVPAAGAYRVVTTDGRTVETSSIALRQNAAVLTTESGPVRMPADEVDYYRTFLRNLGDDQSGNVVAFVTGSLVRFDSLDVKDGVARISLGDRSTLTVPESLIDYRASVLEGATVQLPAGAGSKVGTSRGDGGEVGSARSASSPRTRGQSLAERRARSLADRSERLANRTNPGSRTRRGVSPSSVGDESVPGVDEYDVEPPDDAGSNDDGQDPVDLKDEADGADGQQDQSGGDDDDAGRDARSERGQSLLVLETSDGRDVAGLQVHVSYPANARPISPTGGRAFSGWAADMTTQVGPGRGGSTATPFIVGGFASLGANAEPLHGPGEFLRIVFEWSGEEPAREDYDLVRVTAVDATSAQVPEFTVDMSLR